MYLLFFKFHDMILTVNILDWLNFFKLTNVFLSFY